MYLLCFVCIYRPLPIVEKLDIIAVFTHCYYSLLLLNADSSALVSPEFVTHFSKLFADSQQWTVTVKVLLFP